MMWSIPHCACVCEIQAHRRLAATVPIEENRMAHCPTGRLYLGQACRMEALQFTSKQTECEATRLRTSQRVVLLRQVLLSTRYQLHRGQAGLALAN